MDFEYDPHKSELNKIKNGIDFEEAKAIWDDENAYEFDTIAGEEERFLVIGEIEDKRWTAVITYRESTVRIISVRRSRFKELEEYDNHKRIRREV